MRCQGCYAYLDDHLGDSVGLRQLGDYQGQALVDRFFQLIDKHDPLQVASITPASRRSTRPVARNSQTPGSSAVGVKTTGPSTNLRSNCRA